MIKMPMSPIQMDTEDDVHDIIFKQQKMIDRLKQLLDEKEEEILRLRCLLDKYQSVFSPNLNLNNYYGRRKHRAQGISAEPLSLRTIQELIQTKFPEYPKSER